MPDTIVAFDFGLRRIGIAVGQQITNSANPLAVVRNGENGPDWSAIDKIISDWRPDRIIVGMPAHADGSRTTISDNVDSFIDDLKRFEVPVEIVDERHTSKEAEARLKQQRAAGLRRRIKKETIDSEAAVQIAERWLSS
jgi:putative Holliday junction resolvase